MFSKFSKKCLLLERKSLPACYAAVAWCFVQEIWIHQILHHTNIIKLLGYCIPNTLFDGTVDTTVTMVTEMGIPLNLSNTTWDQKLKISYEVAELMDFARQHPNGSVEMRDFNMGQFVMVNNTVKLVDMASFRIGEMYCHNMDDCAAKQGPPKKRALRVPCVNGSCVGLNEKLNVWAYNSRLLREYILPDAPLIFRRRLNNIVQKADKGEVGIEVIKDILRRMK
ncbi:extracellular tyrosine-protein kinase PKDCC-like [Lingula anatina]|uniref:Extracellular tyrosine-protein kinase PKDCC-like n=1 Tax=Lingula anatina TaxID=7574 RepID=A0A1S3I029_LINAN|nr:extracellular tyrosine-protein kinase PKDCC-like [Lingula anatina]|eukprot:XP_013391622.2 extracellular tyrosine-protein kinase PKDCC-like [Lingula anatina]